MDFRIYFCYCMILRFFCSKSVYTHTPTHPHIVCLEQCLVVSFKASKALFEDPEGFLYALIIKLEH